MAGLCLALSTSSRPDVTTARKSSVKLPFFLLFFVYSMWLKRCGVMICLYSVRDTCDDLILRKVYELDASVFAWLVGCCPSQVWSVVWFLISCAYFGSCILYVLIAYVQFRYHPFYDARVGTKGAWYIACANVVNVNSLPCCVHGHLGFA